MEYSKIYMVRGRDRASAMSYGHMALPKYTPLMRENKTPCSKGVVFKTLYGVLHTLYTVRKNE